MITESFIKTNKTMFLSWFLFIGVILWLAISKDITKTNYEGQINSLTEQLSLRDTYIEEVTIAHKSLYLHTIFDDEATEIINYIDSISFDFFKEIELLEYGCFAIDVCAYYDDMYYNMVTKLDVLQNLCNAECLE